MKKSHQETPQFDANRRRLTKAGLAAPAVLGILASKPVLGAVPYTCTISGQQSGNVSGHQGESCALVGQGQSAWASAYSCKNQCGAGPDQNTTIVSVFPDLTTPYLYLTHGNPDQLFSSNVNGSKVASIYDILNSTTTAATTNALYGQRALVILLSAKSIHDTSLYPVTQSQAEQLFIAAATGGGFTDTNPTVSWSNTQVHTYIDLLWHS